MENRLPQAVLGTIVFFDLFDFVLTEKEIFHYAAIPEEKYLEIRSFLSFYPALASEQGFFFLRGREALIPIRRKKMQQEKMLWQKVKRFQWIMERIPFVKAVFICNNLAFGNVHEGSDIDLFVITKRNRLFLARTFLTALLHLFGVRRHHEKIASRFCLSFFMSEAHPQLDSVALKPHDVYFSHWEKGLKPLTNDHSPLLKRMFETLIDRIIFGNVWEERMKKWQLERAKKKARAGSPGVVILETMLKFHENDPREKIQRAWEERFREVNTSLSGVPVNP